MEGCIVVDFLLSTGVENDLCMSLLRVLFIFDDFIKSVNGHKVLRRINLISKGPCPAMRLSSNHLTFHTSFLVSLL